MAESSHAILGKMLERLYASIVQGPSLNCRPHSSRQRIDLTALQLCRGSPPTSIVPSMLSGARKIEISTRIQAPPIRIGTDVQMEGGEVDRSLYDEQIRLFSKLRDIAEDAHDYEAETGESVLYIGYPLLSIPPGQNRMHESTGRVLAPLAFIPVEITVQRGAIHSVSLMAKGAGVDLLVANFPLLAWLEQQTGLDTSELFTDEEGSDPWREINDLAALLAKSLELSAVTSFTSEQPLVPVPRTEQLPKETAFLNSAVLGLFPVSNQGLLRDLKAMANGESLSGPVTNFLSARALVSAGEGSNSGTIARSNRNMVEERLITEADPYQKRAVHLAREASTLVIHGPPGTGKSQTITNMIGDHLARGDRILVVCEKRTALDVVQNRLEHLGLGDFCAVVHDPQRDQRPLYMKVREQLENLVERKSSPEAEKRLAQTDTELQRIHDELTECYTALALPPHPGEWPFQELVAAYFASETTPEVSLEDRDLAGAIFADFQEAQDQIREVLERGRRVEYPRNPWVQAAGIQLPDLLSRPLSYFRERFIALEKSALALDETWSDEQPPLGADSLQVQTADRNLIAEALTELGTIHLPEVQQLWFGRGLELLKQARSEFESHDWAMTLISSSALDPELEQMVRGRADFAETARGLAALEEYTAVRQKWYGVLALGKRAAAKRVTARYGLPFSASSIERLQNMLMKVKARLLCRDLFQRFLPEQQSLEQIADSELFHQLKRHERFIQLLILLHEKTTPELVPLITRAVSGSAERMVDLLRRSAIRAQVLEAFLLELQQNGLFSQAWLDEVDRDWRAGKPASPQWIDLLSRIETLEPILRLRKSFAEVPPGLQDALARLLDQSAEPEPGLTALKKALLAKEIAARIRNTPALQKIEQERMTRGFQAYRELELLKLELVRDVIVHSCVTRQKSRLLAGTQTQLNSDGTALKRRLLTRGERAMKLRQMILAGKHGVQPDPLFDICPVWMASPATVAQIFPREPVFDLVIFDEASQCRLEEALPVLTRGKRIVVAGDPKQLPPTRFFESAFVESENDDREGEEALFEHQQSETEDLLSAALNIEVQQAYLNVHYRSRNEGLIGFSNTAFYGNRLQPIPAYPANHQAASPIRLIRADGVYEQRGNVKEAQIVVQIVAELLTSPKPPSVGIACFNLPQRDLILDLLEEHGLADPVFAERLQEARTRRGSGSFEGLFVKNLENVQGDERDHMIISTTFGPDREGRFRRNFGPVSRQGGGRRLNVLITRAREQIHLITSIPPAEYSVLPQINSAQPPAGRWLLYAYLNYAENLERAFQPVMKSVSTSVDYKPAAATNKAQNHSPLAPILAKQLLEEQALGSIVGWGNEGFCVDLAARALAGGSPVLGVLCDMNRFSQAADPVEWELFRTTVLEKQGWKFNRVWSPSFYSDPDRHKNAIIAALR